MPSATKLNAQYEQRDIPLLLIDEPKTPERETMEPEYLADLASDIKECGLIKPLIVKPAQKRFEVVAGHRRLLACRIIKYSPVPCRVSVNGVVDPDSRLVSENAHTEAVNAVEEARFYERLLNAQCKHDVDLLCLKVRRRREFVEDRLLLLRGSPNVLTALHRKEISIAVARELNKVSDPNRLLLLLDDQRVAEVARHAGDGLPVGQGGRLGVGRPPLRPGSCRPTQEFARRARDDCLSAPRLLSDDSARSPWAKRSQR